MVHSYLGCKVTLFLLKNKIYLLALMVGVFKASVGLLFLLGNAPEAVMRVKEEDGLEENVGFWSFCCDLCKERF